MSRHALGDVARFVNGAAFKPGDWEDGGLPIIRIQNLTGTGEKFNYTKRQVKPEIVIEPGDLLVSWSATLDVYRWSGPRGLLNQHIFKVFPNSDIDADYLFFALKSVLAELSSKTHGSTMKHVVRGDFESTQIYVPAIQEQSRIVDLLSRAEGIVHLRREAQRKATELVPALFLDMFGDPARNPKGWSARSLLEVFDDITSRANKLQKKDYATHGRFPVVHQGQRENDAFTDDEALVYSGQLPVIAFGDHTRIFKLAEMPFVLGADGVRLLLPSGELDASFAYSMLSAIELPNAGYSRHFKYLREAQLFLPPIGLQRQFAAKADAIRSIAAQQAIALATAQATFDALLHQSFQH